MIAPANFTHAKIILIRLGPGEKRLGIQTKDLYNEATTLTTEFNSQT